MRIGHVLQYRLLGPLTVERDGGALDLGPPKQRAVLAVLAQDAGAVVSTDRLLAAVWGDDHSPGVVSSLQAHLSRLRRLLRDERSTASPILRRSGGYLLDVAPDAVDVTRFLTAAQEARRAVDGRDWAGAVAAAEDALGWWRGAYLEDFRDEEWVRVAEASLRERRVGVLQDAVVGLLGRNDLAAALARSRTMLAEQPLDERAAWLHTVALYRAGRSADALAACRAYADSLREELGLDVGPALRDLESAVLRGDASTASWPGPPHVAVDPTALPGVVEPPLPPSDGAERPDATDLVGRSPELDVVDAVLAHARGTGAAWLVLTGDAGIGKSRLAQEAAHRWRRGGGRVVLGQCLDDEAIPAWWPVKQVLRELGADADAILDEPGGTDADATRFALLDRIRDTLLAQLAGGPLLVVVEDLHWADRASLQLLAFLAAGLPDRGLAVVLTTRNEPRSADLDRVLTGVARRPGSRQIAVPPLSHNEIGLLTEQIAGKPLDPAEAVELAERTGGNPLFVGEYARLDPDERRAHAVPTAVRSVLRRRLAALHDGLLAVVQAAAVLGEPLDVRLLARALRQDVDDVADLLDEAAERELLVPAPTGGGTYGFAHVLLREEAAAGLPALRRQRLHLRAGAALEGLAGDDAVRRAGHLRAAGPLADPVEVVAAARAAALAAEQHGDADTAAAWWGVAVEVHEGDSTAHDELVRAQVAALTRAGRGQDVLDVLDAALVEALRAGHTGSVGRLAANLLRVSGSWPWPAYGSDPAPLLATLRGLDALLGADTAARARVLAVIAIGHCYDLDPAVPDGLSARAVELAETTGDPDVLADALLGRALTFSGVAERSAESIALLDRLGRLAHRFAPTDAVLIHGLATMACMNLGRVEECAEHVEAGTIGSDVQRLPVDRVQLRWARGCLAQWRGDLGRAEQLYAAAEAAHRRTELQQSGTFELAELVLRWDQGRLDEIDGAVPTNPLVAAWTSVAAAAAAGRPGVDEALAAEVRRPEPVVWTSHGRLALLAHAVADRGLAALVEPLERQLAPLAGYLATLGQIGTVGPVAFALARLARLRGDHTVAWAHLADARAQAQRAGGVTAELHCRLVGLEWAVEDRGTPATPDQRRELAELRGIAVSRAMAGAVRRIDALTNLLGR